MIKQFTREIDEELAHLALATGTGENIQPPGAQPVAEGEKVLATIEDPWLKAVFLAHGKRVTQLQTHENRMSLLQTDTLNQVAWAEVMEVHGELGASAIVLREDWKIVEMADVPTEEERAVIAATERLERFLAEVSMLGPSCNNPNCPVHGTHRMRTAKD